MLKHLPKVNTEYGAPMGRVTRRHNEAGRFRMFHVPLDRGGYDAGGAYWGHDRLLYCCQGPEGSQGFYRARSRDEAIGYALEDFPEATFKPHKGVRRY